MGLAELCARKATHQELTELLVALEKDNIRLRNAIEWALDQLDDSSCKELKERAGLIN